MEVGSVAWVRSVNLIEPLLGLKSYNWRRKRENEAEPNRTTFGIEIMLDWLALNHSRELNRTTFGIEMC